MPKFITQNFDVSVHRFPNLESQYHVNKASFSRIFTLNGKLWMLNFEQMESTDVEDSQVCL